MYNILADSDPEVAKFTIQDESVVREFNIVYLKHADLHEKIQWFFPENNNDNRLLSCTHVEIPSSIQWEEGIFVKRMILQKIGISDEA